MTNNVPPTRFLHPVYYPRQKFLGLTPWICPTGLYLPHCAGTHQGPINFDSFEDTNPAFGKAADDECPDPLAIPEDLEIPFFSCREVDEAPTILGIEYWMYNPSLNGGGCSETRVRGVLVWLFKTMLGYECGHCPV